MRSNKLKTLATASIIFGSLTFAQAQEDSDRGWWPGWGMGHMMDRGYGHMMGRGYGHMMGRGYGPMMGHGYSLSNERIEGRLAFIKAELNVTKEQEGAWSTFADALRSESQSHAGSMQSMMESMHSNDYFEQSLPERLALHETHMAERIEQLRTVREAVEALYEKLDDQQKKTADQIVMPIMGMGHGMGMGPRGRRMMRR